MARYSLRFKASVAKDLRRLPKKDVSRILKRIESLAEDAGGEELGVRDVRRVRLERWRMIFEFRQDDVLVLAIRCTRKEGSQ